jgi:hypothetical protein
VLITNTHRASIGGFVTYLRLNEEEGYELIKNSTLGNTSSIEKEGSDGDILFSVHRFWHVF